MARRTAICLPVLILLAVGTLFSAGVLAAQPEPPTADQPEPPKADQAKPPQEDYYELHKLLVDTLDQVERNYVKEVSRRELIEAAIKGILSQLDPYSAYIGPQELDQFRTTVDGNFAGVGIQIAVDNGRLSVLSPLVETPAYRAGIIAGDQIIEIDGKSTEGISLEKAIRQLKGEAGSQVTLAVIHPGKSEPSTVTITRELIRVKTVLGDRRKEDDHWDFMLDRQKQIGYIRVTAFSRDTVRELREALSQLQQENLRGLILDLRFNPGGLLSSAIEVSDLFVSEGRIVSTKGRDPDDPERAWEAHKEGTFEGFAMVVLVNRYTASAGEIVSACLQDHERAVIMGERTWGKGSVQNVIPLEEGRSALKLTTASYYRPSGKNIDRFSAGEDDKDWGVTPNDGYELKLTGEEVFALIHDRGRRDILRPKQPQPAETSEPQPQPPEQVAAEAQPSQPDQQAGSQSAQPEGAVSDQPDAPKAAGNEAAAEPQPSVVVDPQMRMAMDYLTAELAPADEDPHAGNHL